MPLSRQPLPPTLDPLKMQSLKNCVSYLLESSQAEISISQLWIYPLKSCRGIRVDSAQLSAFGFEHDRIYMLVEETPVKDDSSKTVWTAMTMRTWPKMGLIRTAFDLDDEGNRVIRVYAKDSPDSINLPLPPSDEFLEKLSYISSDVDIWGAMVLPYDMGEEYACFFSKLLGTRCKLGYVNAARPRYIRGHLPPPQCQNGRHPQTGLSDGAPVADSWRVCAEESMEDLNSRMEKPLSIIRFRPNIVVKGGKAFDEDHWAEIMIGEGGKFWLYSRSPRCQLPNVDVETGTKDKDFPYKALSKYRRIDKGSPYSPTFGMNAAADRTDGATIRVGDPVTVLRTEEPRPYSNVLDISRIQMSSTG